MKPALSFSLRTAAIIGAAMVLGLSFNASRPDSLPLVYAQKSAVQLDSATGEIGIKDAALLYISKRAIFVDARDAETYAEGHIQGALSLPAFDFAQKLPALRQQLENQTIITYCDGEGCNLSHEVAGWLKDSGFKNVFVLKNGWTLWKAENLPVGTGTGGSQP